jgi:hypothetical protein
VDAPEIDDRYRPFYEGLKALSRISFPKTCSCGRVYETFEHYLAGTTPVEKGHGLMAYETAEATEVGMFRNCVCGSTLVIFCDNRRDESEAGAKRREIFEGLLQRLEKSGIPRELARERLLRAMRTGKLELFGE